MQLNEELKAKLIREMVEMANNNPDKQCYIQPSNYGSARTNESTNSFKEYLLTLDIVKKVDLNAKDLLLVTLKN